MSDPFAQKCPHHFGHPAGLGKLGILTLERDSMRKDFISFLLMTLLLIVFSGNVSSENNRASDTMRVLWTVSDYHILDPNLISEDEGHALLGQPLDIDETVIVFEGQRCSNPSFQREQIDTQAYFASRFAPLSPNDLGIDDATVEVIRTSCSLPGFGEYLRLSNRRLGVFLDGIFLMFTPWVNY
jgi:hypothetical protein